MTDVYKAVYVDALRSALNTLPGAAVKTLLYLVSRTNEMGTCFPSVETIASEMRMSIASVYRGLGFLRAHDYVRVCRENQRDPLTGRHMPNVYIVRGDFLTIQEEHYAMHVGLWRNSPMGHEGSEGRDHSQNRYTKQQHKKQKEGTENEVKPSKQQHQQTATKDANPPEGDVQGEPQTPRQKTPKKLHGDSGKTEQKQQKNPGVPPSPSEPLPKKQLAPGESPFSARRYPTIDPIAEKLDGEHEDVALSLSWNTGAMTVETARGLVQRYGTVACERAMEVLSRSKNVINPPGFVRDLLHKGALTIAQQNSYTNGKYADFIDS